MIEDIEAYKDRLAATGRFTAIFPLEDLKTAAEQGDAEAQNNLGKLYCWGKEVPLDYAEAVKWFRKAAEQRHADAQFHLGEQYYYGFGVTEDYAEAVKWYRKAAKQGHEGAQYNLGYIYFYGEGAAPCFSEAMEWFRKAAKQGNAKAQDNLALMEKKLVEFRQNKFKEAREEGRSDEQPKN